MKPETQISTSNELEVLDELLNSHELWVDRGIEAEAIVENLLKSNSRVIVLYGAAHSGKTQLIRGSVMPLMPNQPAIYMKADTLLKAPEPGAPTTDLENNSAPGKFIFVDEFEKLLLLPNFERNDSLTRFLSTAERNSQSLVFIVQQDYLNRLFQLQQWIPHFMDASYELPPSSNQRLFDTFVAAAARRNIRVLPTALESLRRDLETTSGKSTLDPELFAILVFELSRSRRTDREFGKDDYESSGGITGILETHLDYLFERAPDRAESPIAWAILEEVISVPPGKELDLAGIAARFDVSTETPLKLIQWMEKDRRLLLRDFSGRLHMLPPQLSAAVMVRSARGQDADGHLIVLLRQGVRTFAESSVLLSEPSFRKIHERRSWIRIGEDETQLMLRCALDYESATPPASITHWLARVRNPNAKVDILLESTFDSRPDVRKRATAFLRDFKNPEVRHQIHLMALRDSSEAVREVAIQCLDVTDNSLRIGLAQEAGDLKSPYRIQAIAALQPFKDNETIHTLESIVQSGSADDSEAGISAARALARQDTIPSADALLEIAIGAAGSKSRQNAAIALGIIKSEATMGHVIEKLRTRKPFARTIRTKRSLNHIFMSAVNGCAAAIAILLSFLVHGLVLATLGRKRFALAVTGIEVLAVITFWAAYKTNDSDFMYALIGLGTLIFLASLSIGLLASTRIIVAEKHKLRLAGSYRNWLGPLLFVFDSLTIFVLLPGLAPILAGRVSRGIALIAAQAAGIFLLTTRSVFSGTFKPFIPLSGIFSVAEYSLLILGYGLIVGAYLCGPGWTAIEAFLLPHRREWQHRIQVIASELLRNSAATNIVFKKLASDSSAEVKWATKLIRKHDALFQKFILESWSNVDQTNRQKVLSQMARRPSPNSLEIVKSARVLDGWRGKFRYVRATWNFRMSVLPRYLIVSILVGLAGLAMSVSVLYVRYKNGPDQLMASIQRETNPQRRLKEIENLKILAKSDEQQIAFAAAGFLKNALQDSNIPQNVRIEVLPAWLEVEKDLQMPGDLVGSIDALIKDPELSAENRKLGIKALQQIGTLDAALALKAFIERSGMPGGDAKQDPAKRVENDIDLELKKTAIESLGSIAGKSIEAIPLLEGIGSNRALSADLRDAATEAAKNVDPIASAESELAHSEYKKAIVFARKAQSSPDNAIQLRAGDVLGQAYLQLSAQESDMGHYQEATSDLYMAIDSMPSPEILSDVIRVGFDLAYTLHEEVAPKNPEGFRDTYQLLTKLRTASERVSDMQTDADANLAEASLTTERYEESIRLASELLKNSKLSAYMAINMKFMIFASLAAKGDQAAADKAEKDLQTYYKLLPAGFRNSWSYTGTRKFFDDLAVSPTLKSKVNSILDLIKSKQ